MIKTMNLSDAINQIGGVAPIEGMCIPISDSEVSELEEAIDHQLPPSYRAFLQKFGASIFNEFIEFTPMENLSRKISRDGKGIINLLYGAKGHSPYDLISTYDTYKDRMPSGFLSIGDNGIGDQIAMKMDDGTIYYWDHHNEWDEEDFKGLPIPADLKWKNLTLISTSFDDFLSRLSIRPE
jgi:hypothetical protein